MRITFEMDTESPGFCEYDLECLLHGGAYRRALGEVLAELRNWDKYGLPREASEIAQNDATLVSWIRDRVLEMTEGVPGAPWEL